MINQIIKGTFMSMLVFFSISFLTVLFQINSPLNRIKESYELHIGFPLEYYNEFMVDCPTPNSGWDIKNLILNIGIMILIKKRKHNNG